jgi:hypothetical protein
MGGAERPVPGLAWRRWAPAWLLAGWAAWRRRQGRYDQASLALRHAAWIKSPQSAIRLCQLALFRRDLGRPLPRRWVAPLQTALPTLPLALRRRAIGLLAEAAPQVLPSLPMAWVDDAAGSQPGVSPFGGWASLPDPAGTHREAFAHWLRARCAQGGVCVVGNAAGLAGQGLGPRIDAHAAVLRFNRWQGAPARLDDTGQRLDVWVVAPDLPPQPIPEGLRWAIVSGPDPRFLMRQWALADQLTAAGVQVLTVPLPVWRRLVQALKAPPSAGLLVLAWLQQLLGEEAGLTVAGIGWGRAASGRHHLLLGNRGIGRRHDWAAEAACMARWRGRGLRDLAPP